MEGISGDYDAIRDALLRDGSRDQVIHEWISDQYKFALEEGGCADATTPTSLNPRPSMHADMHEYHEPLDEDEYPCYDDLFVQPCRGAPVVHDNVHDETEREVALRFLLHEMRDWYLDDDDRKRRINKPLPPRPRELSSASSSSMPMSSTPSSLYSSTPPTSPTTQQTPSLFSQTSAPSSCSSLTISPRLFPRRDASTRSFPTEEPISPTAASFPFLQRPPPPIRSATTNTPYLSPSSATNRGEASRWSLSTSIMDHENASADSLKSSSPAKALRSPRSMNFNVDFGRLMSLSPRARRKKLLVRGVDFEDQRGFDSVRVWCESLGPVLRCSRKQNGDIHVHFRKSSVAAQVCRLNTRVYIKGAGSVVLSHFTGKRP